MATNTSALKTFAQETRKKLISLITTKMQFVLGADTAELRGYEREIGELRKQIQAKTEKVVIEEVAYTWFNRVMALRFMDANGYNAPMIVTPAAGQTRPEILQEAMGGNIEEELMLTPEEKLLPEAKLYRKLLVAVCNKQMSQPMPFLFEHISDYTELLLPVDLLSDQSFVSDIRNGMTDEDCQNVELIGWLYQFYITDRKADAETKKSKKGGLKSDEQAAATQLFTPHWIVRYMVENSLGRIWMTLHPESRLVDSMPYYIPTPEGQTDTIPEDIHQAKDIRFIDPCMGSGHILVYAFDLFTKMYEEEGQMTRDIPTLILQNNLYGIDIDRRCYQLAAFALTMKARAYERRYLRHTVMPNVIALEPIDRDTIESTGAWPAKSLMWQFEHIDTIGSLLKVTPEECAAIHVEQGLFGIRQQVMKTQAEYLSRLYHCVVTNPPYLGKGMGDALKKYIVDTYPNTKGDCMATFMERCLDFNCHAGKTAMINQDSWMFTSSYEEFRHNFLNSDVQIENLIHLGPHAFAEIGGEKVKTTTFVVGKYKSDNKGCYISVYDAKYHYEKESLSLEAMRNHSCGWFYQVSQNAFSHIAGNPISFWGTDRIYETFTRNRPLSAVANPCVGLQTADNGRFLRSWFEVAYSRTDFGCKNAALAARSQKKWFPYNKGGSARRWYGNQELVVNWENDGSEIKNYPGAVVRNPTFYFRKSISWGLISGPLFRYFPEGFIYDVQGMSTFYDSEQQMYKDIAWLNTKVFNAASRIISPAGHIQIGEIGNMPCCDNPCENIEEVAKDNISISKYDWDSHETSWDFKRNPLWEQQLEVFVDELSDTMPDLTVDDIEDYHAPDLLQPLSVLVANCESKWEDLFYKLHSNEEELNRKFIEIYGLQDELTPDVALDEVTILQKQEISIEDNLVVWHDDVVIKQFISWLIGCFMGRYSPDQPGLIIASQGQKVADLGLKKQTIEIDDDGIIPVIMEEDFFADDMTQRIEAAVKALFGEKYFHDNMKFIRTAIGMPLRDYLYKNFYADHQQMYSVKGAKRPIYWLFNSAMGDKRKKGYFKALVYMHRLEADTLSKLHADYVHPYIQKIEQQLVEAEDNALRDDLTGKQKKNALDLAETLRDKVREVKAFETQLVEMASARITIDLDDGVKANYPKFYPLVEPIKGLESSNDD
jgi:hypothetical protein